MIPLLLLFLLILSLPGCRIKPGQLPYSDYPYAAEVEFLKEVKNVNGRAKKTKFKHNRITSPFYFFVKIKEIENDGVVAVCFYATARAETGEPGKTGESGKSGEAGDKKVVERTFYFGEAGKYYEYIIFFDRVEELIPGQYRYAIFLNRRLIYEDRVVISPPETK